MVASLALNGCVTEEAAESPRPAILPIDTLTDDGGRIDKWVRPVRISLAGEGAEEHRGHVAEWAAALRSVTGHPIAMAEGDNGDLWLVFGTETPKATLGRHAEVYAPLYSNEAAMAADLQDDGEEDLCRAKRGMSTENRHEIVYAAGAIPAGLGGAQTSSCISRLLVTALGTSGTKSLSNNQAPRPDTSAKAATGIQIILLKVWYDKRVKPGMTVAEVQPVMNEAMQDVMKERFKKP
ncbi:DUF2927 domain-containing protein [Pelagibius sp. CAU 1746]|uniref:DUF2927 domain-containing protein n=1 Tax=Pelagibius sp. CAU 1746 TaxID=3140370 RepID=UPI00325B4F83